MSFISYLLGLDVIGQQNTTNGWNYFGYDGLGTVRGMFNSNANLVQSSYFDPYGNPIIDTGFNTSLGFTGEQQDSSGLVHLRARMYDPFTGTFLQQDPFAGWKTRAMSQNGYSYIEGNPINYLDPSGKFIPLLIVGAAIGGAAIGALGELIINQNVRSLDDLKNVNWDCVGQMALRGALFGAFAASLALAPIPTIVGGVTNVIGGFVGNYMSKLVAGEAMSLDQELLSYFSPNNWDTIAVDFMVGGIFGSFFNASFASTNGRMLARATKMGATNVGQGIAGRLTHKHILGEDVEVLNPLLHMILLLGQGVHCYLIRCLKEYQEYLLHAVMFLIIS